MAARKLKLGEIVLVKVDPLQNNGSDEAPATIVRVLNVEEEDRVNVRVHLDGDETLLLRNVEVLSKKPKADEDAPVRFAVRP